MQRIIRNYFYLATAITVYVAWIALTRYGRPFLFPGASPGILYLAPALASAAGLAVAHRFDRRTRATVRTPAYVPAPTAGPRSP